MDLFSESTSGDDIGEDEEHLEIAGVPPIDSEIDASSIIPRDRPQHLTPCPVGGTRIMRRTTDAKDHTLFECLDAGDGIRPDTYSESRNHDCEGRVCSPLILC